MSVFLGCTAMSRSFFPLRRRKEATLTLTLRLLFVEKIELFGLGGNNERLLDKIWRELTP